MKERMPLVSIIMPLNGNEEDLVPSVRSILAQGFENWELILALCGPGTEAVEELPKLDERIRILSQPSQGPIEAANTALKVSRGSHLAFIEPGVEWSPQHLRLAMAFFHDCPAENLFSTELLEQLPGGRCVRHYYHELHDDYPAFASRVGSQDLDLPAGESDVWLRIFSSRHFPLKWTAGVLEDADVRTTSLYRGIIADSMRWGDLLSLYSTVISREAFLRAGMLESRHGTAAGLDYCIRLCRQFSANLLPVTGARISRLSPDRALGAPVPWHAEWAEIEHAEEILSCLLEHFPVEQQRHGEVRKIAGQRLLHIATLYNLYGDQEKAVLCLSKALDYDPGLWEASLLRKMLLVLPDPRLAAAIQRVCRSIHHATLELRLAARKLLRLLWAPVFSVSWHARRVRPTACFGAAVTFGSSYF